MISLEGTPAPSMRERGATRSDEAGCSEGYMDTAIPTTAPPQETRVSRYYRNTMTDLHLLLQAMRRGEMPEPLAEHDEQMPRMLREAATRLEGGVW